MGKVYKRPLTLHQSDSCTSAQHPRCTCRCGGILHGIDHKDFMEIEQNIIKQQGQITEDEVMEIVYFLREQRLEGD